MSLCLAEERERSECSIDLPKTYVSSCDRAAAHVPLPRITMSKSHARGELPFCQRRNTARKVCAQRAAWARYIGGAFSQVKR
jgi:hypothetical protein